MDRPLPRRRSSDINISGTHAHVTFAYSHSHSAQSYPGATSTCYIGNSTDGTSISHFGDQVLPNFPLEPQGLVPVEGTRSIISNPSDFRRSPVPPVPNPPQSPQPLQSNKTTRTHSDHTLLGPPSFTTHSETVSEEVHHSQAAAFGTENETRSLSGGKDDWLEMASRRRVSNAETYRENMMILSNTKPEYSKRSRNWFFPGRIVGVPDGTDECITGRAMIVMGVTSESEIQCLSICRHANLVGRESPKFYNTHVRLYTDTPPKSEASPSRNNPVELKLTPGSKLRDSCWVNCEHSWMLLGRVPLADLGSIDPSMMLDLLRIYRKVHGDFFEQVESELRKMVV